jgi:hypothetical protein
VAYVVPAPGAPEPGPDELRQHLAARLPAHLLPAAFVFLEALPLTPGGKVDRRALPRPDGVRPALSSPLVAPRTAAEVALTRIWSDLLGVSPVGIHDNFFDLGGHSLLALRAQARLEAELGRELPVVDLFQFPTIASLAAHLTASPGGAPEGTDGQRGLRGQGRAALRRQLAQQGRRPQPSKTA